jgi:hypothetical protein
MERRKSWNDLSPSRQRAIVAAGVVQLLLATAALLDLRRRPSEQVRGPKAAMDGGRVRQHRGPARLLRPRPAARPIP